MAPVWAPMFLPQVLEAWGEPEVQPRLKGRSVRLRLADACVIGGELAADARRSMAVRPQRFTRDGLTLHPTKTALRAFGQPAGRPAAKPRHGPGDVLGWTHDRTTARRGFWVIKRRTARQRFRRPTKSWWRWGRAPRHAPWPAPYPRRCLQWRGHLRSDGLPGNVRRLEEVRRSAEKAWRYGLSRRSSTRAIGWEKFPQQLEPAVRPTPRIVHNMC